MSAKHVSEAPVLAAVVGGLLFGMDESLLEDGDLTSLSAAKAAVDTDNAKLHVSERRFGPRVKASLDEVGNYDSTYVTGSDVDKSTMLALSSARRGRMLI